ncbi:MAG: aminomethyl-transferring glycine dehydrogenase subunit GcvPA [Fibrobacteres bacterium]|nr:aminomethyl-transferring glycine dehydrogenase subunit GcvPA [Fibrobacterota bacterium]
MLAVSGVTGTDELLKAIPAHLRLKKPLELPKALSEMALSREVRRMAGKNRGLTELTTFLGMGWTKHFIPAAVDSIVSRSEFTTAYTPYQAEASQGSLQQIFEYQTMVTELTGMEVSNASLYDGATSLVEGLVMASASTKGRKRFAIAQSLNPRWREVAQTYAPSNNWTFQDIAWDKATGQLDRSSVEAALASGQIAALVVQTPNAFGMVEDLEGLSLAAKAAGALLLVAIDPLSLSVIEPPSTYGADIVVGDMLGLGIPTSLGGPGLGLLATRKSLLRQMPGRVVGRTLDAEGKRAYCLTAQTREQHIRREKATSNICSNQGLMVVSASVYLALQGPAGLAEVAEQCASRLAYVRDALAKAGIRPLFSGTCIQEQAFVLGAGSRARVESACHTAGLLPGVWLADHVHHLPSETLLVCVNETHTRADLDLLVATLSTAGGI